jgi:hypothetical protein
LIRIGQEARLPHLAVRDHIKTRFSLSSHDLCHGLIGARCELGLVNCLAA